MKDLIEFIAKHLVDHPESVVVNEVGADHAALLELKVGISDTGKVIGKKGRTVDALRTILTAVAAKQKKRMRLEIID